MKKDSLKHIKHRQERARSQLARKHARDRIRSWWRGHPDLFKLFMANGRDASNFAQATKSNRRARGLRSAYRKKFKFLGWNAA